MDMSPYRDLFISESREHLRAVSELIVKVEQEAGSRKDMDALFRAAHSLKGMAASMGYGEIAELSHRIEDLMDRVRMRTSGAAEHRSLPLEACMRQ